ncbi:response regulator transcription factor [Marinobacter sp. NP-4(2019)]|uniref:response regulator transcription factor n=1 Tax=Marinobacter sp. NP-4(2019) TaxID=2488665 RepID=UPI003A520D61
MSELMEKAYPHLPEGDFTRSVGQLFGLSVAKVNAAPLAEPISEREQGVLELIAKGLSNQEIADQLHISLHTVKTHARRINAKLEVKSRTQAIVRARELGLL